MAFKRNEFVSFAVISRKSTEAHESLCAIGEKTSAESLMRNNIPLTQTQNSANSD